MSTAKQKSIMLSITLVVVVLAALVRFIGLLKQDSGRKTREQDQVEDIHE